MYLLDTNVVSELRRPSPHGAVLDWISRVSANQLYISAVTVGEIQAGIEVTRQQDAARAAQLEAWLDRLLLTHEVLAVDAPAFRIWAKLIHHQSDTLMHHALIAAVATVHRLTVVTRNTRDFQHLNVPTLNPFDSHPR